MRELCFFRQADIQGENVLVDLILDHVNLGFQSADFVQQRCILLQCIHLGEEHADALFKQLKLLFGNVEDLIQILCISCRANDSLENHDFRDCLALVRNLIAAGSDRDQIFTCRGKEPSLRESIIARRERSASASAS